MVAALPASAWWYLGLLAAVAVERLLELALSRRNAALAFAAGAVEVGQGHFGFMAVFHVAFLACCAAEVVLAGRAFPGTWGWWCLGLVVAAQALRYWAIATLGPMWNVRVIVWKDRAPVTAGPYRWVRHPNYVAVVVELLALPLVHGAFITALVFSLGNVLLLRVRIAVEEAALGPSYQQALGGRPRFLPGRGG